jgi:aryl-alcohol dehydrogenase-like predicted oxidoreductase
MSSERFLLGGDLPVRRLGFGAMRIVSCPAGQARAVLRRAVELGVELIDTADAYGAGVSEERIADALHPYPDGLVIHTKVGLIDDGSHAWPRDGRPEHLRAAVDASLVRLRLERLDAVSLHRIDERVPLEESVGALDELRCAGKVRHVGLSNVSLEELRRAQAVCPIVCVQNEYNRDDRRDEDVLEACERDGIGFMPWYPLAGSGRSPVELLRWLLERSPVLLPIPGTSSLAHLEDNMRAVTPEAVP